MKTRVILCALVILGGLLFSFSSRRTAATPVAAQTQSPWSDDPAKVPVYVSNFEIDVAPASREQRLAAAAANARPGVKIEQPPDPFQQAGWLVDVVAAKLVSELEKAGYPAKRLRREDDRPPEGVEIRGLFVEVDSQNHWRRAVIRTGVDTGKMEAMVAVANLARPEQALYEIAPLPGNEDKPGAVITLSPYVPLQKYDLYKDADDNAMADVAAQVVEDLTALLGQNPTAVPK